MSTKIFYAWRVPTQDLNELLHIGKQVRDAQRESYAEHISDRAAALVMDAKNAAALYAMDSEIKVLAECACSPIRSVCALQSLRPTWLLDANTKIQLETWLTEKLRCCGSTLEDMAKTCIFSAYVQLCATIAETMCRETQSLCFVKGDEGSTYLKGFGLTKESIAFLNCRYQPFDYTDATDMQIQDFRGMDGLMEDYRTATAQEKAEILSMAQKVRGELWEQALGENDRFCDAGLKFDIAPELNDHVMKSIVMKTVAKAAGVGKPVRIGMLCYDGGFGGSIPAVVPYQDAPANAVASHETRYLAFHTMIRLATDEVAYLKESGMNAEMAADTSNETVSVNLKDGSPLTIYFIEDKEAAKA